MAEPVERSWLKRLIWSALLAASGALANALAQRAAHYLWRQLFAEEPPE